MIDQLIDRLEPHSVGSIIPELDKRVAYLPLAYEVMGGFATLCLSVSDRENGFSVVTLTCNGKIVEHGIYPNGDERDTKIRLAMERKPA